MITNIMLKRIYLLLPILHLYKESQTITAGRVLGTYTLWLAAVRCTWGLEHPLADGVHDLAAAGEAKHNQARLIRV